MISHNKKKYLENLPQSIPIFHQPYWLDCVAPNWNVAIIEKNNKIVASMPYWNVNKKITMPPLTQFLGPYINERENIKISDEHKILTKLEEQITGFSRYEQRWQYIYNNWLPFYWKNFKQTSKYTYIIDTSKNKDELWKKVRSSTRSDINKSKKLGIKIKFDLDFDDFFRLVENTFSKQGLNLPYSKSFLYALTKTCKINKVGEILFAVNQDDEVIASSFLVWDKYSTYYILSGIDDKYKRTGASSFLMWESILFGSTKATIFDFEGSMIKRIETFFRSFGTEQRTYFEISKTMSKKLKLKSAISDIKQAIMYG